jgi:hypothetical protein
VTGREPNSREKAEMLTSEARRAERADKSPQGTC